ncbi:MAG: nucleotidyltransferase family protein [Nitrospirae bacterium]|nr:nucleotidyltransferase family protein [Nitrospirota bacterium]
MKRIDEIKSALKAEKSRLELEYGVSEIGLFGSRVTGIATDASDIDILVDFHRSIDLLRFVHLKNELSDLLELRVDLVMKRAVKPEIGRHITNEAVFI